MTKPKPGDQLIVAGGRYSNVMTVDRVTPTGQLICKSLRFIPERKPGHYKQSSDHSITARLKPS